ncbi:hypothetical protein AKJ51_00495 [candidate division MSBL1 archaeon SCGC-AAA382A20]|uniref:Peptidase S24/S26A/S26B/S26C domain-containing protein n=1 Tax=candidate division MSBL1 archaeon SCGC-AAA382A20 TaxID=1698280 RepID=A0A133VML3_9EURY|nr:hypothetical protein AKJ51_00495 [candidate division MSBL1 archaeon SCGC-AAA382A20]
MNRGEKIAYGLIIFIFASAGIFYISPLRFYQGHGTSMEPLIRDGDGIVVISVPRERIQENDIITFRVEDGYLITHMVVGFENGKIITHGVNLPKNNLEKVDYSQVVGEHVLTIPKAGIVLQYVSSTPGFILLILIPTILIIYNEARKIRNELKNEKNNL